MQVNNFFIDLALRLLFIDLHFFIATIQIGVIVQVCYTPQARLLSPRAFGTRLNKSLSHLAFSV